MNLDILVIAAHPGDAEASCGGTLIRMASQGYRAGVLDLTMGDPEAAAENVTDGLQLSWRENQRMPEGRLENSLPARMTVAMRIRELKPRVVVLPYWESTDPDQVHCSALAAEACFLAGLASLEEYSEPHRPERVLYGSLFADVRPSFVVDISAQFEQGCAALAGYAAPRMHGAIDRREALARYHGASIGVRYGEPFVMKEVLAVDDIVRQV
jgi:N-acetylglucosamine malate deacetylase 1